MRTKTLAKNHLHGRREANYSCLKQVTWARRDQVARKKIVQPRDSHEKSSVRGPVAPQAYLTLALAFNLLPLIPCA